jgi:hypothetical protein
MATTPYNPKYIKIFDILIIISFLKNVGRNRNQTAGFLKTDFTAPITTFMQTLASTYYYLIIDLLQPPPPPLVLV